MLNLSFARIMINRMKITANIPDELIGELKSQHPGENLTDALKNAIVDSVRSYKLKKIIEHVSESPLQFQTDIDAELIRETNRR